MRDPEGGDLRFRLGEPTIIVTHEQRIARDILGLAREANGHYERLKALFSPHRLGPDGDAGQTLRDLDAARYHADKLAELATRTKNDIDLFYANQTETEFVDCETQVDFDAMYVAHALTFGQQFLSRYDDRGFLSAPSQQWLRAVSEDFDTDRLARDLSDLLDLPVEATQRLAHAFRTKLSWHVRVQLESVPNWFTRLKTQADTTDFAVIAQLAADDLFIATRRVCESPSAFLSAQPILMAPDKFPQLTDQRHSSNENGHSIDSDHSHTADWSNVWTDLITAVLEGFDYSSGDYAKYVIRTGTVLNRLREDPQLDYMREELEILFSDFGRKHVLDGLTPSPDSIEKVARTMAIYERDPVAKPCGSKRGVSQGSGPTHRSPSAPLINTVASPAEDVPAYGIGDFIAPPTPCARVKQAERST